MSPRSPRSTSTSTSPSSSGGALPHRARVLVAATLMAASAMVGAGCYQTPQPACAFACARDGSCPDGYACDPQDQICHRVLTGGALEACDQPFLDAATIDAAVTIDAAIDASVQVDAAIDAP